MADRAKTKALFRTKLRESEQKREKQISSPFIRYNELDQPVCRVCNVTLKSESLWPAHQVSRKHHEAIESFKATAAGLNRESKLNVEPPVESHETQPSSTLPSDFFDNQAIKRQKNDMSAGSKTQPATYLAGSGLSDKPHGKRKTSPSVDGSFKVPQPVKKTNGLASVHPTDINVRSEDIPSTKLGQPSKTIEREDTKQAKGALPVNFFDNKESESLSSDQPRDVPENVNNSDAKQVMRAPLSTFSDWKERTGTDQLSQPSKTPDGSEAKQVTGALPEGFFDNKDADLRARGIEPVKVDINDAFKEFEKVIQEDLQEVDDRMEEEEIDAAEVREEFESLEQRAFRDQVEMMKKNLIEAKAARLAKEQKATAFMGKESSGESSSDDDDDDDEVDDFAVDWRAKHL